MISKRIQWLWCFLSPYSLPKHHFVLQETFLRSQGIVDHLFNLNDPCNLANSELVFTWSPASSVLLVLSTVDASLHIAMDKYAMFAVTCSHNCLDKYIEITTAENEQWISHLANGKSYTRDLRVS